MNPIKTFKKGGVHPEENKLSADLPIQDFPMPKQIIVPLGQCLGAPAECIVNRVLRQEHEKGRGILVITHDADTAAQAKTVLRLRDGILSPKETEPA